MYEVNFKAVANLSQVFAKLAKANKIKDATIVNVSSIVRDLKINLGNSIFLKN